MPSEKLILTPKFFNDATIAGRGRQSLSLLLSNTPEIIQVLKNLEMPLLAVQDMINASNLHLKRLQKFPHDPQQHRVIEAQHLHPLPKLPELRKKVRMRVTWSRIPRSKKCKPLDSVYRQCALPIRPLRHFPVAVTGSLRL